MKANTASKAEKALVITGGSSGIGQELARQLAAQGHHILAVSRRADLAIRHEGKGTITGVAADLSSNEGVRSASAQVHQLTTSVTGLVNCASSVSSERRETVDGLEYSFALNYLSYFHLTGLLLPLLLKAPAPRVINVSAAPVPWVTLDFDDLQTTRSYGGAKAYLRSKLADVMFTYGLAELTRHTPLAAVAVHPGIVKTNLGKDSSTGLLQLFNALAARFAEDVEPAAARIALLAGDPSLKERSGRFFAKGREARSSRHSYNKQAQRRLWQSSIEILGVDPYAASCNEPGAAVARRG